jgi:hypothetical protein
MRFCGRSSLVLALLLGDRGEFGAFFFRLIFRNQEVTLFRHAAPCNCVRRIGAFLSSYGGGKTSIHYSDPG